MKKPTVSIGMPVYNGELFICEALDSLLSQTFSDFELIISDNASTDGTEAICLEYAARDERIRYVRQPENLGATANFKFVLDEAVGEYFLWAAYDDVRSPIFLEVLVSALDKDVDCTSAFGVFEQIDDCGKCISEKIILNYAGDTLLSRVCKYWVDLRALRDVWIYGLHRKHVLKRVILKPWAWVNKDNPVNSAHPMLTFMLTQGNYYFYSDGVIFFRRLLSAGSLWAKDVKYGNRACREFKHLLLKLNLVARSTSEVIRGSGSAITGGLSFFCIFFSVIRGLAKRYLHFINRLIFGINR